MSPQQFHCSLVSWDVVLWTPSISLLVRMLGWQKSSMAQQGKLGHVAVSWGIQSHQQKYCRFGIKFCPLFFFFFSVSLQKQSSVVQCFTFLFTSVVINGTEDSYPVLRTEVMMLQFVVSLLRKAQAELCEEMTLYGCQKFQILLAKIVKCCTCLLSYKTQCHSGPNVKMVEYWVWKSFFMPLMQKAFYSQN